MNILRQLNASMVPGTNTSLAASPDVRQQITDLNPRYIQLLAASGKASWGQTAIAATGSLSISLPQAYVTTNMLSVFFTSDQTVEFSTTGGPIGGSHQMVRAGLNQVGVVTQCGAITSIIILGHPTLTANIEWFLYELPDVLSEAGWRDGSLATGTES